MQVKDWLAEQLRSAIVSKPGVKARRWLGLASAPVANHELDQIPVAAEVVVYFSDVVNKAYQLEQWLPTLEKLHQTHRVVLVFRKVPSFRHFRKLTGLPKIFVRRLDDLVNLYESNNFKLCLYVNNGVANFQSLSTAKPVHVHINHGESDKLSMVSNQAKAYDKIFVAGPAAIERHRAVLLDFDLDRLITVGRPQLDTHFASELPAFHGRTFMYAPTWEGENDANNYTSMDVFGEKIVEALIALPNTRVIYKPHPRIPTSTNPAIAGAHDHIRAMLEEQNAVGGQHLIAESFNILALFNDVDGLITDVSSVGLDYLYLHPEKPLILTDRRDDLEKLNREVPVSRASPVISESTRDVILTDLAPLLGCSGNMQRLHMRSFYFGDRERGSSTTAFIEAVGKLIGERERQLRYYESHGQGVDPGEIE
ncbi:CDP-glycerol glycerophosphotransferase family protein [Paeniglutamicibacter sulfureus]|uniref:CDP-glycerol glycerophosphotransferase family protein n=1 Tax=Paeniglutamicibacter sulfureus TaxID=43666 RepID=UPI0026659C9F|nr:CDP-glycerol glycerophosphotransferase family protein [Paeniglutamicibacter sulfureus]MDO2936055.1 CDP-glycerol glycerophosphotransferase family protein [Paeniglutamicibacter sulfureus]